MNTLTAWFKRIDPLFAAFACASLLLHLLPFITGPYGYFRDELYYLACADHIDIGYVDHPPLSVWLLGVWRFLFGESLIMLRLLPMLAGAVTVYLTGLITRELGGGRSAQFLALAATTLSPIIVGMGALYTMNIFDILLWVIILLLVLRWLKNQDSRFWPLAGILLGLGLLNKISMGWLAAGIAVAVLATHYRTWLRTPYPWIAAGLALLIFLPFIIWNLNHDLAHIEFMRRAAGQKYQTQNPVTFIAGLVMSNNPLVFPVWLLGLWMLLRKREHRFVGIIVATVLAILFINYHTKSEYFTPAMPLLFAAGAVWLETTVAAHRFRVLPYVYGGLAVVTGIGILPMTLDVLSPEQFMRYQKALGLEPVSVEAHELPGLPQHFADRFGWPEMAEQMAKAYATLTPEEQRECLLVGRNYGEAGAIDFFGKHYGLPKAMSQHNSYYYWGFKQYSGQQVFLVIRRDPADLRETFESVEKRGSIQHPFAMPYESNLSIWLCKKPKISFEEAWKRGKNFI